MGRSGREQNETSERRVRSVKSGPAEQRFVSSKDAMAPIDNLVAAAVAVHGAAVRVVSAASAHSRLWNRSLPVGPAQPV